MAAGIVLMIPTAGSFGVFLEPPSDPLVQVVKVLLFAAFAAAAAEFWYGYKGWRKCRRGVPK
jgi:hypothetical protein